MPLSTSNSSWLKTWGVALLLFVLIGVLFELSWRNRGHTPGVVDDFALWSLYREQAINNPNAVVLLGASRMQLGFDTASFQERFPNYDLYQLAVLGGNPIPTLKDLAADEAFNGIVVCSVVAESLSLPNFGLQNDYVAYYHEQWNLNNKLNRFIRTWLQERVMVINPDVNLLRIAEIVAEDRPILTNYTHTQLDRSTPTDYSRFDWQFLQTARGNAITQRRSNFPPMTPEVWATMSGSIDPFVQQIQARGGQVVFVRFPTQGVVWESDEAFYPRAQYWDQFATTSSALTLHFQDAPAIDQWELPDWSHLDQRDTAAFTDALLDELAKLNVLQEE